MTDHIKRKMASAGLTGAQIKGALRDPYKVTPVTRYPGQRRYCGYGVAVIVQPEADGTLTLITAYLDGVITDLRPDQMNDQAALNSRRLASR